MCEGAGRMCEGASRCSLTPDILISDGDQKFLQSLRDFIQHERTYLQCPEDGPDELRHALYRSVFSQLIGRATAYKRLLLTIKGEYDATIRALKRREDEEAANQRAAAASASRTRSLITCRTRANQLRDRISVLQRDTADVEELIRRQRSCRQQTTWIPGVTVAQSEDLEALERRVKDLEAQRAALLDTKSQCVPLEVQTRLEAELQDGELLRERLKSENNRLKVLHKRLRFVCDSLSSWSEEEDVPLEDLLVSTMKSIRPAGVKDDEDPRSVDSELFEEDEPTGVDECGLLRDHLDRFTELFDAARYEDAAQLAATAPRGVLRSVHIMDMFKGVRGPPGSLPPLLLFFQALLMSVLPEDRLSSSVSLQGVLCALQQDVLQLVVHAVTQNKLTFSEDLGDELTEHAQKKPGAADTCLSLAFVVYEALGLHRKAALSMCRRGLIHSAAEFMKTSEDLTAEDCLWVLHHSSSLLLLQMLTEPRRGRGAVLSVGGACAALLVDRRQQQMALQLLDDFVRRGGGVLQEVILEDGGSSVDVWTDVASLCSELQRDDLSRAVMSVLLDQSGTRVLSPDLEGVRLMEHVFL